MPLIPNQFLRVYKKTSLIKDRFNWLIKKVIWKYSPNLRETISRADHILCMNQNAATLLKDKNARFSILPSIAAHDKGYTINFAPESFTLISAGKLVPHKGFDLSILAFAAFLSELKEEEKEKTKLLIAGNGPELALFKNMVSENKIEKYVDFVGHLQADELNQLLRNSSAFIFPSHYGSGMEVAEALSAGIPVIHLDNTGHTDLITNKCGFTISSNDYDSTVTQLADAIKVLHSNKKTLLSMSLNARERFESSYDWNVRGIQLNKIYFNI
jgi:glycosyltransferase involved in cell wall biosynthesis